MVQIKPGILQVSIKQISYLLHLFQERHLQTHTVDGSRTAIADKIGMKVFTLRIKTYIDLYTVFILKEHRDSEVSLLNLSPVLHQLNQAPFEPLTKALLKDLMFKK